MKNNTKIKGLVAASLALTVGFTALAFGGAATASAEEGYGDNLVVNGNFDEYGKSLKLAGTYAAGDKLPLPYTEYDGRYHDVYCRKAIPGGSGFFVKTEDNAYISLQYDGEATGDSIEFWVQPGKLPTGTYTVEMNVDLVGLSTGDCVIFNFNGAAMKSIFNADDYAACEDSATEGLKKISYEVTIGEDTDYPATHIWFYHKFQRGVQAHLYDITYKNAAGEAIYFNDFSGPFDDGVGGTNLEIVKENDNVALQMNANSTLNIPLKIDGVGNYRVRMDVKPSDDYTGRLESWVDDRFDFSWRTIAGGKADFEFLDESDMEGWVHFSGTYMVNNFVEPDVVALALAHEGEGSVMIDNIVLEKKENSVIRQETPSTEGLEFNDIVLGGDFEYLEEGYVFTPAPQADCNFWGSTELDSPGKIVSLNGNKVLKIAYDPNDPNKKTNRWASAFVFLDPSKFNAEDIFTLSYKYKYEGKEGFDPGIGFQVTFVGGSGVEHYVQYLNYVDTLKETSGVNTNEWPFTVTELEGGWKQVTLTFKMDSAFVSQVDSIRFLNYNNCQEDVVLYIDDVKYGVWQEPGANTPGDDKPGTDQPGDDKPGTDNPGTEKPGDEKPSEGGCGSYVGTVSVTAALAIVAAMATGIAVAKKKKEN